MTLSDKKSPGGNGDYWGKDVKEFIKKLKEELRRHQEDEFIPFECIDVKRVIDKLAGDDLI